jgi:tRNA dimethylallyltransferase
LKNRDGLPYVLILLGPTGVGKTGASLRVARYLNTEIISADSMQVYKCMDIGTAKPTPRQLGSVKHHMIDRVYPSESFSSGRFREEVWPVFERLQREKKVPLVVGGTGLYIKTMTRGLFSAPEADLSLREDLLATEKVAPGVLYEKLREIDPEAADKITPGDTRRIVRALEVYTKTEKPISELQKSLTEPLPCAFVKIGLTRTRKELYTLIEERVDAMFDAGLVDEVKRVMAMNPVYTALQAIGYKEVVQHLKGEIGLEETVTRVKKASRRYAKRQFTWFRKEEGIRWVDITGIFDEHEISAMVIRAFENVLAEDAS